MGNTANNNWPYPESTDLVKDGATAIENLADAIDTTLGVYADSGLVLLNTTSFSAVSSQSFDDVFSATYDNYRIMFNYGGSSSTICRIKFRVGGVDNSGSNYFTQNWTVSAGSGTGAVEGPVTTGFQIGSHTATNFISIFDIGSPFLSSRQTTFFGFRAFSADMNIRSGVHTVSSSFDGFTVIPTTGTITGDISVYGYNK